MLARWDSEGNFESIFKKNIVSSEAKGIFKDIDDLDLNSKTIAWDKWADSMVKTDKNLKAFLITEDEAYKTKDLATYTKYLNDHNKTLDTATLKTKAWAFAKNAALNIGFTLVMMGISKAIDSMVNSQENAIKKADEFIEKFEEQRNTLTSNKKTIDSISSDYEKLAKGVDSLGRNVSLNTDEYARYNDIVNQIADMFPHMVQGYTDEGNAIIKCKGDVEELTQAYKDQKDAAQDAIIVGSAEVFAGFKASTDKDPEYIWEESGLLQMKELVDKIVATGGDVERIQEVINGLGGNSLVIGDVFDKIGLDKGWFDWNTLDAEYISENIKKFQSLFNTLNTEIDAQAAKIKPIMQAYLEQSDKFQLADEKVQDMVKQIVGQFDAEFYSQFDSETQMASWVEENVIDKLRGNKDLVNDFSVMFDLQTKFNKGDITVTEYQEKLTAFLSLIDTLPDETQKAIKLLFGITTNDDGTTSSDVDTMVANVKEKFKGKFEKEIGQLKLDELEILTNLDISPDGIKDWSEVETLIANAGKEANKMTVSIGDLEKASESISSLSTAYKELSDNGYITTKTISDIKEAVGDSVDNWDEYEKTLLTAKVGSAELDQVLSELTYKILENEFATIDFVNATDEEVKAIENKIAATLRENGVTNANAVAHEYVTWAKVNEAIATYDGTQASYDSAAALISESLSADQAQVAMARLEIAKLMVNNAQIRTSGDIDEIIALANAAGASTEFLRDLSRAKAELSEGFIGPISPTTKEIMDGGYTPTYNKLNADDFKVTAPKYSGGGKSGGSGSGSNKNSAEDAAKKELEALKESLETREKILERYKKSVDITDYGLDLAEENDFALRADLLNNKLSQLTSYGLAMREEFDRISNIIPETGEQAEALGSTLESLGDNMRDNITAIRETQVAMEKLAIDSIASVGNEHLKELEAELDSIEKRMELLNKDNGDDYQYTNEILSMKMFLPTSSSFSSARNSRRSSDQEIIQSAQDTQDVLNDIYVAQIQKNEDLREDERQALLADMEQMRSDTQIVLKSVGIDYENSWNATQQTTNTGIVNVETAIHNMNLKIPKPDISLVVEAFNQVSQIIAQMGKLKFEPMVVKTADGGGDVDSIIRGNRPTIVKNVAEGQLGVPYVWGGISPFAGLDCSGLTQYAYKVAGVNIPRTSQEQWNSSIGTRVDKDSLQTGDQLFFGKEGEATHTGIYVGNGIMIHAPRTGDVVKRTSINTDYYQSNWIGAKRYATGTSSSSNGVALVGDDKEGKLNKIRPELVITKNGARLVGTKGAEFVNLEKGDQVIPYEKTKQILNRSGDSVPRFATGTPMTNEKYLKEIKEACDIFGVPYNIALSLIDQESANGTASDTWRANSENAVGLTQITPSALGDFGETQYQVVKDIVELLKENNVDYTKSRVENESAYRDNIWTGIANLKLLNDRYFNGTDNTWKKTLGWYYAGGNYNGSDGQWYANQVINRANSQSFVDAAKALGDNTNALNENTTAIEETDPIQEEIKRIQSIPDEYIDQIGTATLTGRTQAQAIYNDESLSNAEKNAGLYEVYKPMAQEAARIGRDMYAVAMENYLAWKADVDAGITEYSKAIDDEYTQLFEDIEDYAYSYEDRLVEIRETAISNIVEPYDRTIALLENRSQQLDSQMQLAETKGLMTSTRYYEKMRDAENKKLEQLTSQRDDLVKFFNDGVASGDIKVGSSVWYDMQNQIDGCTASIDETKASIAEVDVQMRQILWDRFDYLAESFSNLTSEADFLINLLGEDLHKDNGRFNDEGMAVVGLHGANYNVYMEKALSYAQELAKIEEEIANNPNDINLIARKQELLELQRESILAAESEKQAIVDLVEEGINLELESLQDLISAYTDSLDEAKNLYDYQRKISEQTENISTIEKQLAAYENDTSEETKAKVQQLKVDLEEAQQNLKDTEYDKYIEDQKELLDDLYSQFEDTLNSRLDDVDALIEDMIDSINSNASSIADTLKSETGKVGTELSDSMWKVWNAEDNALKSYLDEDSLIGGFKLAANGYFEKMGSDDSGVLASLGGISTNINSIMEYASQIAKSEEESDYNKNQMIQNSKNWWGADSDTKQQLEKENDIYGNTLGYTKGEDGVWRDNDGDPAYTLSMSDTLETLEDLISRMRQNSLDWFVSSEDDQTYLANKNAGIKDDISLLLSKGYTTSEKNKLANVLVDKMEQNSADWAVSDDNGKSVLEAQNKYLAQLLANLTGKKVEYDDASGKWSISKYASGGLADYTGLAWLDGTPSKPEMVLSAQDTKNFIDLKDYLAKATEQGLFKSPVTIPEFSANLLPENTFKRNAVSSSMRDVNFNIAIDHVEDYNDFVNQLRKDRQFEKMIQSMSVDLLAGKSSLAKNKYRW